MDLLEWIGLDWIDFECVLSFGFVLVLLMLMLMLIRFASF